MIGHATSVKLDDARGGWLASCSCGWQAKRPSFYKARAAGFASKHVGEAKRWGALPMGERP